MADQSPTRTVPVGYLLHNPHAVSIRLLEFTTKCLRFRVEDNRNWHLVVDKQTKSATICLTGAA